MTFVATLEPPALWKHFDRILTIPRGSKDEGRMRDFVIGIAKAKDLKVETDATGNIVVRKPATAGRSSAPITILQSHLDMVNEKNSGVGHDFSTDPIKPNRDGAYLTATGTTLGSDNGIGVAAMLAVMEADDIAHGPLELLFTVDEETGLTGASNLDGKLLRGRQLLNLDSEEEGALYVGCAGGADSTLLVPVTAAKPSRGSVAVEVKLHGLKGGHSGIDIILQRGNAVQLLARVLYAARGEIPFRLARLEGGNKHNAIPREAVATVILKSSDRTAFDGMLEREFAAVQAEYRAADPGIRFELADLKLPPTGWDDDTTGGVLRLLTSLPHGVLGMSHDIEGLVETSTNLATVVERDGALVIGTSSRSSVSSALQAVQHRIRAIGELAGATVEEGNGYPGWAPNLDSHLLNVLKRVHTEQHGTEPDIKAIHAGLECGIIGEKVPGMDMISFGPQIEHPHSPDERVHIESVGRFYQLLVTTLDALSHP
jgi:dipeptidase D